MRLAFCIRIRSFFAQRLVIAASVLALNGCLDFNSSVATYSLSGTISGLTADGLVLTDGDATMVTTASAATTTLSTGATSFTAATAFKFGQSYALTVTTQPPGLICSVANGTGTFAMVNVTNVAITCVPTYTLGGTISGLSEPGLVLANNGESLTITPAMGTFAFTTRPVTATTYAVTVQSAPQE